MSVLTNKNIAADIAPHIYSALRDPGVIFGTYILFISHKFLDSETAGTLDLC